MRNRNFRSHRSSTGLPAGIPIFVNLKSTLSIINKDFKILNHFQRFHIRRTIFHVNMMKLSNKYSLLCTPGPRDSHHRIGSRSGTGPLDYESRDPVPDPETLPFKYVFGQLSFNLKKQKNEKHGSLVVSAHTGLRC